LLEKKTYDPLDFCARTINNALNRLGYSLKKVLKTLPLRKIPETDAIFENVKAKHEWAKNNKAILRISLDVKAKVRIGNLSRKGYSRTPSAQKALDHDQNWDTTLVPLGINEINTGEVFFAFGNSKETSDFIVDGLELWWKEKSINFSEYSILMIDLDNGSSVSGVTRRFIERLTIFAKRTKMSIQLVYYPPYHSKYNPIERVWARLENYWSGLILDTIPNTLKIAQRITWKGMSPIVRFIDKEYEKPARITNKQFKLIEQRIVRNPLLPKWDIWINSD
jgi:transposase